MCRPGSNGGDGFVVSRHLAVVGRDVRLALLWHRDHLKGEAAHYAALWSGAVALLTPEGLDDAMLVVDALCGAGQRRVLDAPVTPIFAAAAPRPQRRRAKWCRRRPQGPRLGDRTPQRSRDHQCERAADAGDGGGGGWQAAAALRLHHAGLCRSAEACPQPRIMLLRRSDAAQQRYNSSYIQRQREAPQGCCHAWDIG